MEMLKNMGIQMISKEDEQNLKKELKKMEEANKKAIEETMLTAEDELIEKYGEEKLRKLRELGMNDM